MAKFEIQKTCKVHVHNLFFKLKAAIQKKKIARLSRNRDGNDFAMEEEQNYEDETCPESFLLVEPVQNGLFFPELANLSEFLNSEQKKFRAILINHNSAVDRWVHETSPFIRNLRQKQIDKIKQFAQSDQQLNEKIQFVLWTQVYSRSENFVNLISKLNHQTQKQCMLAQDIYNQRNSLRKQTTNEMSRINESFAQNRMINTHEISQLKKKVDRIISLSQRFGKVIDKYEQTAETKQELYFQNIEMIRGLVINEDMRNMMSTGKGLWGEVA